MNGRHLLTAMLLSGGIIICGCAEEPAPGDHAGHDHGPAQVQPGRAPSEHEHDHNHEHEHEGHDDHDHGNHEGDAHAHEHPEAAGGTEDHMDHAGHADHPDHADEVTLTPEAVRRWGIRVEPASRQVLTDTLRVPARVSLNLEAVAHVGSVVSGRVSEVKTHVGDAVEAGDVLLVVASPELGQAQSDFLQKRAAIVTAEASLQVARALHERARTLYEESQGIALSEVQRREAEWRSAEGAVAAARGAATAAENLLHLLGMDQPAVQTLADTGEIDPRFLLRAPIAGQVIEREATLGESVGPEREALAIIADLTTLWVIASVPEPRIGQVAEGAEAAIAVPALPEAIYQGVVRYVAAQLDPDTRTVPVRIEVRNDQSGLRPGMFAQATLTAGQTAEAVLAIPEAAVQVVEGHTCVFVPVEGEPHTFATRKVELGPQVGATVPVLEGLREGEPYVAAGSFILKADLGKAGAAHVH